MRNENICKTWWFQRVWLQLGQNDCLILLLKIPLKDYSIPIKARSVSCKTPHFTCLKGLSTSSLCKFWFVFQQRVVPQNTLSISISRICSHGCPHLYPNFTHSSQSGQIPLLPPLFSPPRSFCPLNTLQDESSSTQSHVALHHLLNFNVSISCSFNYVLTSQGQGSYSKLLHFPFSNFQGAYKYLVNWSVYTIVTVIKLVSLCAGQKNIARRIQRWFFQGSMV